MAVRSERLAGPVELTPGTYTLVYTVPAGKTAIVKFLAAYTDATESQLILRRGAPSLANAMYKRKFFQAESLRESVWIVLHEGEQLYAGCFLGAMGFSAHGAELQGVSS